MTNDFMRCIVLWVSMLLSFTNDVAARHASPPLFHDCACFIVLLKVAAQTLPCPPCMEELSARAGNAIDTRDFAGSCPFYQCL